MAIYIRVKVPEPKTWIEAKEQQKKQPNIRRKNEWLTVFKEAKTRKIFLFWILTSTFLQFGYYGVGTWLPSYLVQDLGFDFKSMTGYLVGSYLAMILGKVLAGLLSDRFGRRNVYILAGFIDSNIFASHIYV